MPQMGQVRAHSSPAERPAPPKSGTSAAAALDVERKADPPDGLVALGDVHEVA